MALDINNRKETYNLQVLPCMPPNFVNFSPETNKNGWRVFAPHPLNFLTA